MSAESSAEAYWTGGALPSNVRAGRGTVITGDRWTDDQVFRKFQARHERALVIGEGCRMDGVLFNVGKSGHLVIGDHCRFEEAILICEGDIRIGNRVIIGWRATIVDSDFHPLSPEERLEDVVACSPLAEGPRPAIPSFSVVVEDDVWIGPNATILKGVRVGAGAFIEPGAVVVHDVPARARALGNPARVIGQV
jgi:acetyltransferase-like isoleucine patch superfamily enzyme